MNVGYLSACKILMNGDKNPQVLMYTPFHKPNCVYSANRSRVYYTLKLFASIVYTVELAYWEHALMGTTCLLGTLFICTAEILLFLI